MFSWLVVWDSAVWGRLRLLSCFLLQTVANIGSTLTSVAHDVENIQTAIEEYKKSIEILQNDVVRKMDCFHTAQYEAS